jgi:TRAP-type C4-dicarboxylate transport system substrate-binding protein
MKRLIIGAAAVAAVAFAGPALAQTKTIKLLSSWDKTTYAAYEAALAFQERLKTASGGKMEIDLKGPETVPPFQQIQPVSAGVFDMLFTHGVYHAGSKGLTLVADAIEPDLEKRRSSGVIDFLDKYYQKHNKLTMVGLSVMGTNGYAFVSRDPLSPAGDFNNKKIRATQSYFGVIKAMNGTPVVIPGPETYSAMEKGVVDGAVWPASGVYTMKWYEVAKYRIRPSFGTSNEPFFYNMAAWAKLSAEEQGWIKGAVKATEDYMLKQGDVTLAKEDAELDKLGMKVIQLAPDKAAIIKKTFADSLWEVADQCCGDGSKELREIAKKANLTN